MHSSVTLCFTYIRDDDNDFQTSVDDKLGSVFLLMCVALDDVSVMAG